MKADSQVNADVEVFGRLIVMHRAAASVAPSAKQSQAVGGKEWKQSELQRLHTTLIIGGGLVLERMCEANSGPGRPGTDDNPDVADDLLVPGPALVLDRLLVLTTIGTWRKIC